MGTLYGFVSVFLMSSVPVMNKFILTTISPIQGAFANAAISTLFFGIIGFSKTRSFKIKIDRYSAIAGVANAIGLVLVFSAIERIHPALAGLMGRLGIVFAMVLSVAFLGEKPEKVELVLAAIALLGAAGSALSEFNSASTVGLLMAMGSALSFNFSNLCLKLASHQGTNLNIMTLMNLISALVLACGFGLIPEQINLPHEINAWALIIFATLVGSCLGYWFYLISLRKITLSMASLIRATGPLFTAAFAYPFFGLNLNTGQALSASVLMASVIGLAVTNRN